jgi:CheY-like chemotaxis protein
MVQALPYGAFTIPHREEDRMPAHPSARILLIDDEPGFVNPLARLLCHDGYTVGTAVDGPQALAKLRAAPYDLILCDLRLPEVDGPVVLSI